MAFFFEIGWHFPEYGAHWSIGTPVLSRALLSVPRTGGYPHPRPAHS